MITSLDTIKKTLNSNYHVIFPSNTKEMHDHYIQELSEKILKEFPFINGLGWGETNLTKQCTYLYVFKGEKFSKRVAMAGKAGNCPIISTCATSKIQLKYYGDFKCKSFSKENLEILKIRNEEGVSHGINASNSIIVDKQEIISNIFVSWGDKKVNEKKFFSKNKNTFNNYLELVSKFLEKKYI